MAEDVTMYWKEKSTRTAKNAVKGAQLLEKVKKNSHNKTIFHKYTLLFHIETNTLHKGISVKHTYMTAQLPAVSSWWRQLKKPCTDLVFGVEEEKEKER